MFQKVSGIEKIYALREFHDFLWKICCLTVPKNFVGEPISVSLNSSIKKFLFERVMSRFSKGSLSSQSSDRLRSETLLRSTKILEFEKNYGRAREGGEGLLHFSVKGFCLTVLKKLVEEPSVFEKNTGIEKKLAIRERASITIFLQIVLSQCSKILGRGTLLRSTKFLVSKRIMDKREGGREGGREVRRDGGREGGIISFFFQKSDGSQYQKTSYRNPLECH